MVVVCRNSSLIMTILLIVYGNDKFDFDDNGIIKDWFMVFRPAVIFQHHCLGS